MCPPWGHRAVTFDKPHVAAQARQRDIGDAEVRGQVFEGDAGSPVGVVCQQEGVALLGVVLQKGLFALHLAVEQGAHGVVLQGLPCGAAPRCFAGAIQRQGPDDAVFQRFHVKRRRLRAKPGCDRPKHGARQKEVLVGLGANAVEVEKAQCTGFHPPQVLPDVAGAQQGLAPGQERASGGARPGRQVVGEWPQLAGKGLCEWRLRGGRHQWENQGLAGCRVESC